MIQTNEQNESSHNTEKGILDELIVQASDLPSDDYFSQLKTNVMQQIEQPQIRIVTFKRIWIIAAAACVIGVTITLFWNKKQTPLLEETKLDFSSVSKEEVLQYVEENISEFESESLVEHIHTIPNPVQIVVGSSIFEDDRAEQKKNPSRLEIKESIQSLDREEILKYLKENENELEEEFILGS